MLDFGHLPDGLNILHYLPSGVSTGNLVRPQTWTKPRGAKMFYFRLIAGAGSGGGGASGTATIRSGGGGGASGQVLHFLIPASLVPDILYLYPGLGGASVAAGTAGNAGNPSYILLDPNVAAAAGTLFLSASGTANGGGAGTTTAGALGAAGSASGYAAASTSCAGLLTSVAGKPGFAGGASAAGVGTTILSLGFFLHGGLGGGGTTAANVDAAGGGYAGVSGLPSIAPALLGGLAGGGQGNDGYVHPQKIVMLGGTGGGSNGAGTAGAGGTGGIGCGGGGGGGGTTGGRGGKGGDGMITIAWW